MDDQKILEQLFAQMHEQNVSKKEVRLHWLCEQFLGVSYLNSCCGEGAESEFDPSPLYRFDYFDCVTFVNTVLALTLSDSAEAFVEFYRKTNYQKGFVDYCHRLHFISVDWNPNAQKLGLVADITKHLGDAKTAHALIDKKAWYHHKAEKFHTLADRVELAVSDIDYLSMQDCIDGWPSLSGALPAAAIIEIIRPNWDLTKQIGTHLNVMHIGIAFNTGEEVLFYHASKEQGGVVKLPLIDYLIWQAEQSGERGINIQACVTIRS